MNRNTFAVVSAAALLAALSGTSVQASPGLDIRSVGAGPVTPGNAPAGPAIDPTTQNGQWFLNNNGLEDFRTHEFHDNIAGSGGGNPDHLAIRGSFAGYTGGGGFVTGYQLSVSITNNTPNVNGPWASQPNLHGESRLVPSSTYSGTMYGVRFSSHWADDGNPNNFTNVFPSIGSNITAGAAASPGTSNTIAMNYDSLAWYCYTNGQAGAVGGQYQVPTWDFGDIAVNQTVTRLLTFHFYNAVAATAVPPVSSFAGQDLLIARTNDLRIGSYFQDDPAMNGVFDRFFPYPPGSLNPASLTAQYANSSVFFSTVPAPGTAAAIGLAGLAVSRRRRPIKW